MSTPPPSASPGHSYQSTAAPPPPVGYSFQPYPPHPYPPQPRLNVFALVAFISSFVVSLAGIICGHIALSQIKRTGETGGGFALAGLIIGYVGTLLGILWTAVCVVAIVVGSVGAAHASMTPQGSSPVSKADRAIVVTSSKELLTAVDAVAQTMVDAPGPSREALNTAAEAFKGRVTDLQSVMLRTDAHYVNDGLDALSSDLAEYQSSSADNQDASQIKVDVIGIKDSLATLDRDSH